MLQAGGSNTAPVVAMSRVGCIVLTCQPGAQGYLMDIIHCSPSWPVQCSDGPRSSNANEETRQAPTNPPFLDVEQ